MQNLSYGQKVRRWGEAGFSVHRDPGTSTFSWGLTRGSSQGGACLQDLEKGCELISMGRWLWEPGEENSSAEVAAWKKSPVRAELLSSRQQGCCSHKFPLSFIPISSCKLWFSNPHDLLPPTQMLWTKLSELNLCSQHDGWFFFQLLTASSQKTWVSTYEVPKQMLKLHKPGTQSMGKK